MKILVMSDSHSSLRFMRMCMVIRDSVRPGKWMWLIPPVQETLSVQVYPLVSPMAKHWHRHVTSVLCWPLL